MFNAVVLQAAATYPTVFPQMIKNIETIQGDGGTGTIFKVTFIDSGKHFLFPLSSLGRSRIE
ncbi:unnamed protein product [Linum tenue]|uniref:Uncharacterized protein n=1 Tax=Linum tenue TaxID=586396 RepID=A0AAV0MZ04_9ROSI|nr:unnamed protein product [Linum tenue]